MTQLRLQALQAGTLAPIDLDWPGPQTIAIHGPSGSGKTLLLRAIADLDEHHGEVWLDDQARSSMPGPVWRRRVGYLPAESGWWADSVGEHAEDWPETWLSQLGFERDVLDWEIRRLSTGERQRLAAVRLLANQPKALLLDEPTANLDATNTELVEKLIRDFQQANQAPALWVSHDPGQRARIADRSYLIADHRLQEENA